MTATLGGLWLVTLLGVAVALFVWARACSALGRLVEIHHIYYGVLLALAPPMWFGWWALVPWALGVWIAWDDALLHEDQADYWRPGMRKLTGADDTTSFWHQLAARLKVI